MGHQADHRRPSLRIPGRRDDARGLVQQDMGERLGRDGPPVQLHPVVRADDRPELRYLPVDSDAP